MNVDPVSATHRLPVTRELRAEPRRALSTQATVFIVDGPTVDADTTNISAHGVDLCSCVELPPATRCELAFNLPIDGEPRSVHVQACVVRSEARGGAFSAGLVFFGMPDRTRELLELFVCST
ncbi:PilZ domain-containing protein [Ideonella sp. DXS29W]|uniref:PilZ domain-containing protein n=1 Tax=Ideonella lacteola TaxID=2984193 RepID=A0ABU9BZ07_9BURK